jgi:hypothetical protein
MSEYYQQGDVLMFREDIPENAKSKDRHDRGYILAEGEVTGHAHVVEDIDGVEMFELGEDLFLRADHDVIVKHEEHNHIKIPAGDYRIGIVKEYDHFEEEARQVTD